MPERAPDAIDVAFPLAGTALPDDYSFALMREICRCLPWFDSDADVGVHPIRAAPTGYGVLLLSRRTRLVLRMPRARVHDAMALAGQVFEISGNALHVGEGRVRPLQPHGALYSHCVAADCDGEQAFSVEMTSRLADLGTPCACVCGRERKLFGGERTVQGFGLLLHGLAHEHSLLVQRAGIGNHRKLGCGVFVRHRLATAVGVG